MTLLEIAQKKNCGGAGATNTGRLGCLVELATPEHLIEMPKNFVIPKDTVFDLAYIKTQVQSGKFRPILGASSFEDVSAEDAYNTNSSGEKRLNLKGLIEHRYMFEEGHEFYKQMSRFESYKSSSFIIGDDEGNWLMAKNSSGDYIGFTAGHVTPEARKSKVKGGDNEMKPLSIQFLDRKQWDENYAIFLYENLGFTPEEISTINGVNMSFNGTPVGATDTLDVNVVLSSDNNTPVEGMLAADFLVTGDDIALTVSTAVEDTPGNYTITLSATYAAADVMNVSTNAVIDVSDVLYRSSLSANEAAA